MAAAASTSLSSLSTAIIEEFSHTTLHSRRLLLFISPPSASPPSALPRNNSNNNNFDANVVMVLSVLLCALICSLGINSMIRCALRCSTLVVAESGEGTPAQLANTGIKKKALKTFPIISYAADLKLPGLDTECNICISDFATGERVRVLPTCNHGFHVRCIDKWLTSHSSCPTCRHCLIQTCNKIVGCTQSAPTTSTPPIQQLVIRIEPLQPEGLIRNHAT